MQFWMSTVLSVAPGRGGAVGRRVVGDRAAARDRDRVGGLGGRRGRVPQVNRVDPVELGRVSRVLLQAERGPRRNRRAADERVELVPEVARVAVGGVLVAPVVVVVALVLPALDGVHGQRLAERAVHVEVEGGGLAAAGGGVRNRGAHVNEVDRLAGVVGPLHRLAGSVQQDIGVPVGLALRRVVLAGRRRSQRHHAGPAAKRPLRRLIRAEGGGRPGHARARGARRLIGRRGDRPRRGDQHRDPRQGRDHTEDGEYAAEATFQAHDAEHTFTDDMMQ